MTSIDTPEFREMLAYHHYEKVNLPKIIAYIDAKIAEAEVAAVQRHIKYMEGEGFTEVLTS